MENNGYKLNQAEWRGRVTAKLEIIEKKLDEFNKTCDIIWKRFDKIEDDVSKNTMKIAAVGGTAGIIVSLIVFILSKLFNV